MKEVKCLNERHVMENKFKSNESTFSSKNVFLMNN